MVAKHFKSKKAQLKEYIRACHVVKTSDVIRWGSENYSNRAERDARDMAENGQIRRMSAEDKKLRFGDIKEEVWITNG